MNRIDRTGQRFGQLVVVEMLYGYKGKGTYARCKCDCGNETIAFMGNIIKGATQSCGCLERESRFGRKNHEKDLTEQRFGYLTAISKTDKRYSNGSVGWLCECDCGNQLVVRSGNLLREHTRSCGCKKSSKYEDLVEEYLLDNRITYHREFKFNDCKDRSPLPFDFYLPNVDGTKYCIECQGQQHYMPVKIFGGEERFAVYQFHDKIKRQYCEANDITLIELPYTLSRQEAMKKLDSILNPVTTTAM